MTPEAKSRQTIDALLEQAGWHVCDMADANIHAARGVALREFPLNTGYGFADYLLYIDGRAAGVIEAKKAGSTLTGVEVQSARYAKGLPESLPAWLRPLPFSYESTGIETHFTQGLDPHPRARSVFAFHRPGTLAALLQYLPASGANLPSGAVHTGTEVPSGTHFGASTFLTRLQSMPQLLEDGLWPAQITAIRNLEASLAANKPRALIQMATGSGKTYTAIRSAPALPVAANPNQEPTMTKLHTLVDLENVHPTIEDLRKLVPRMTDAWVFHGPNQAKEAAQLKAAHDAITLVPHSGKGKNALDFHLSFYLGYVAARQPEARLVVVANDRGYDSMINHAGTLGFSVQRIGFHPKAVPAAVKKSVAAKKVVAKPQAGAEATKTPATTVAPPAKKAAVPVKKSVPVKKAAGKKAPAKKQAAANKPAMKATAPAKKLAQPAAAAGSESKAYLRVKKALARMGKEFPHKLKSFQRHVQAMLGKDGGAAELGLVVRQLQRSGIVTIAGEQVTYRPTDGGAAA